LKSNDVFSGETKSGA